MSAAVIRARAGRLRSRATEIATISNNVERDALWVWWEREMQILRVDAKRVGVDL